MKLTEFESLDVLKKYLNNGNKLNNIVFQSLDLSEFTLQLLSHPLENCIFMGCKIDPGIVDEIIYKGALVFPPLVGIPYKAFRNSLYTPEELLDGFERNNPDSIDNMFDTKVFNHFVKKGKTNPSSIFETFARSLHDHSIEDSLKEFVENKKVVAIMGGHSIKRDEIEFKNVVLISKRLTELGFIMTSGGGPGAMEATHVGAWFAGRTQEDLNKGINYLSQLTDYKEKYDWISTAIEVKKNFPLIKRGGKFFESLGIPTWLYGHEPPTIFATSIAKYFANSIREEGLLAIAKSGVIFSPGSAGTVQEVFQDGAQNHYITEGVISPMIFFGKDFWTNKLPAYDLLKRIAKGKEYEKLIIITDDIDEVVDFISKQYD